MNGAVRGRELLGALLKVNTNMPLHPTQDLPKDQVTTGLGQSIPLQWLPQIEPYCCVGVLGQTVCFAWAVVQQGQCRNQLGVGSDLSPLCLKGFPHVLCSLVSGVRLPQPICPSYTLTSQGALSLPYKTPKLGHPIYASIHSLLRLAVCNFLFVLESSPGHRY